MSSWEGVVWWSFLYLGFRRVLQLMVLRFRRREYKDIEILVLGVCAHPG